MQVSEQALIVIAALVDTDAADANGDDDVNIADVTALIDYLLTGSWN